MKMMRMFLVVAITCVTTFAQAGTVKWTSVGMFNDSNAKVGANATLYVYLLDKTAFDGLTDVWATYGDNVKAGGSEAVKAKSASYNSVATVSTPKNTAEADTTYYAAIIATIGTGDSMKYYAEKGSIMTGNDGNGTYTFGAGTLNTAANASEAWKSASATPPAGVPEPTSGLLFLVGASLLALRRKQK